MQKDLYEILQVSPNADEEIIESAYRRLALKYHPDHNSDPGSADRMKEINAAYDVLGDPVRRMLYDTARKGRQDAPKSAESSTDNNPHSSNPVHSSSGTKKSDDESTGASSTPRNPSTICQSCGRLAPTKHVTLYQNLGFIILRFHKKVEGDLCRNCIGKYFWEYTLKTLVLGWFGVISLILMPLILLNNSYYYLSALGLATSDADPKHTGSTRSATKSKGWAVAFAILAIVACIVLIPVFSKIDLRPPSQPIPTPLGNTVSQNSSGPDKPPTPDLLSGFQQITEEEKYFCGSDAIIRGGPGHQYEYRDSAQNGYYLKVYGNNGSWYYLGRDDAGKDYFIERTAECPSPTITVQARPTATQTNTDLSWQANFVAITERWVDICGETAIFLGPNTSYNSNGIAHIGERWKVFGYVNDWYFLGNDEQGRASFIHKSKVCLETGDPPPTHHAISAPNEPTRPPFTFTLAEVTPMPRQEIPVCAPYGRVFMLPDESSGVVTYIKKDGKFPVTGKIDVWYRGSSVDDKGIPTFSGYIQQQDLCFAPDPAAKCDDFLYNKWKNGKLEGYSPPCTPQ